MKSFSVFLIAGALIIGATQCKKDECDTANMSFKDDIKPLLQDKGCMASGCHNNSATNGDYNVYADFKFTVDNNRLIGSIKHEPNFSRMPKGGSKLDDCSISKIEAWVNQGAKDN